MATSRAANQRVGSGNFQITDSKSLFQTIYNAFKEVIKKNIKNYDTLESFNVFFITYFRDNFNGTVFSAMHKEWVKQSGRNDPTDLQSIRFNSNQMAWLTVEFVILGYNFRARLEKYYQAKHAKVQSIEEAMQSIEDLVDEREVAEIMADMTFPPGNLLEEEEEDNSSSKRQKPGSSMKPVTTQTTSLTYPGNTLRAHMQHLNINLP